jgi:hypothetical protein
MDPLTFTLGLLFAAGALFAFPVVRRDIRGHIELAANARHDGRLRDGQHHEAEAALLGCAWGALAFFGVLLLFAPLLPA